jgi:CRISPR-associated protein Cas8a1/Csx13
MESLTCDLFSPGMTPLYRAGLGGLVSTLRWIEKKVPAAERPRGSWTIDERSVKLTWEKNDGDKTLFETLFALAYQLKDDLIYLGGQYGELAPPLEVRAALQEGLLLSFYDHGVQSRGKKGDARVSTYEVDDKPITYRYLPLSWYKHKRDGYKFFQQALDGTLEITRTLFPGATERHAGLSGTHVTHAAELALPLLFAPVGTIALRAGGKRVNDRGKRRFKPGAALLVPDLHNLSAVQYLLPALLPRNAQDCQVTNAADAALQAELRLRSRDLLNPDAIPAIRCVWCCPSDWNSRLQPPSFVTEVNIKTADPKLDQFEVAMHALASPAPKKTEKTGNYFWPRSYVRPLVAENLASGQQWYAGFNRVMTDQDPVNNKPLCKYLYLERKGLHAMTQEIRWDHPGEEAIVRAVHEALRCRYGRIASENTKNPAAMKNRMKREYERLRLGFSGAKTADGLRHALADLWSRAGSNSVLKETWPQVLPMLTSDKWELTRDLALVALASYQGKEQEDIDLTNVEDETQGTEETEEQS